MRPIVQTEEKKKIKKEKGKKKKKEKSGGTDGQRNLKFGRGKKRTTHYVGYCPNRVTLTTLILDNYFPLRKFWRKNIYVYIYVFAVFANGNTGRYFLEKKSNLALDRNSF